MQSRLVFVDFETDNSEGLGLQIWHPNFKVTSAAFLDGDNAVCLFDHEQIKNHLQYLKEQEVSFVVFNAAFDCTIMRYLYNIDTAFSRSVDVWRVAFYCNQTVDDKFSKKKLRNTSLPGAVKYFFGEDDFKAKHLQYLIDIGQATSIKDAHKNVGSLPQDRLEAYNIEDVVQTKRVYEHCCALLDYWGVSWKKDHMLYMHECSLYADSFMTGTLIDREKLAENIVKATSKIDELTAAIRANEHVKQVEQMIRAVPRLTNPLIKKHKERFQEKWFLGEPTPQEIIEDMTEEVPFNFNSCMHKKILFIDILKGEVVKYTKGGKPELSKKTLSAYGDLGKEFTTLLKWLKARKEMQTIEALSSVDGYLHPMLRSSTTVSSRSSSTMG